MQFKKTKLTAFLLAGCLGFSGCASTAASQPAAPLVTLRILLRGSMSGTEEVLEEFERRTAQSLGLHLEINAIDATRYDDELNTVLDSQEDYDIVFDGSWMSMSQRIMNGDYLPLETYMNNPAYPGLQTAFRADYLEPNYIAGHLYTLPVSSSYYDVPGVFYRSDLLAKYSLGFPEITNIEQYQAFCDAVLADPDTDIAPISVGFRGLFRMFFDEIAQRNNNILEVNGWSYSQFPISVVLDATGKQVLDVVVAGDDAERFAALPGTIQTDYFREQFLENADWNRYLEPNSMMENDAATLFYQGAAASMEGTIGSSSIPVQDTLQTTVPGATVGFFPYWPEFQSDLQKNSIVSTMQNWNFIAIPAYSDHQEQALSFLNWIFSNQENNDLITHGVEGTDWMDCGDNTYTRVATSQYDFPAYTLSNNPLYLRMYVGVPENEKKIFAYCADIEYYKKSPLAGFSLDTTKIKKEYTQLNELYAQYYQPFYHGAYGSKTEAMLTEFHEKAQALDLEVVRQNIRQQVQTFLDNK